MDITIFNTLTRKKEVLRPLEAGHVRLYVCGITSYDYCHIGHARSALVFDMVVRHLRYRGYKVTFVRNFTDIDDKIIKRAAEQGVTPEALALRFIDEFYRDMDGLGVLRADLEPKATEHIPEMIALIEDLLGKNLAYVAGGDVYFRVERFGAYGRLAGRNLEDMQAGARIEVNEAKEHPMDFVLWKGSKPGEPAWSSPWGPGRPGWHIECSAMSRKYLGETFDIHGGGMDLIFPHHENEIAQSQGAHGSGSFARLWMHHGFVTIRDEKMSKSLGNFLTIRDVLNRNEPEALRLFIFSTQYRNPLDFSEAALQEAGSALERMYECLAAVASLAESGEEKGQARIGGEEGEKYTLLAERFCQAMDNDFNSAQALGHLFEMVKLLNRERAAAGEKPSAYDVQLLRRGAGKLKELAGVLGLLQEEPSAWLQRRRERLLAGSGLDPATVEDLIVRRRKAREARDWAASDAIRDELLAHGIELQDGPEGTRWSVTQQGG